MSSSEELTESSTHDQKAAYAKAFEKALEEKISPQNSSSSPDQRETPSSSHGTANFNVESAEKYFYD
jgi:hypothetical protein